MAEPQRSDLAYLLGRIAALARAAYKLAEDEDTDDVCWLVAEIEDLVKEADTLANNLYTSRGPQQATAGAAS